MLLRLNIFAAMELGYDAYSYFMVRCEPDGAGSYVVSDSELDLERDFVGLRYKSLSGLGNYGKVRGVYTEEYAEEDGVGVYVSASVVRESFELVLSLYFFPPSGTWEVDIDSFASGVDLARGVYESFVDYVSGCLLVYRDSLRQRRCLLYLGKACEPSVDSVNGIPYLSVSFTFVSVLGRSYPLDDGTIAGWLGVDSLPVYGS